MEKAVLRVEPPLEAYGQCTMFILGSLDDWKVRSGLPISVN